jgi:cytochrome P450 family 4
VSNNASFVKLFSVIFCFRDSVGASLAFAIFLLAQHQSHQDKCIEEISEIFRDDNRAPTMNDLKEMKYLEMCIKEALR